MPKGFRPKALLARSAARIGKEMAKAVAGVGIGAVGMADGDEGGADDGEPLQPAMTSGTRKTVIGDSRMLNVSVPLAQGVRR